MDLESKSDALKGAVLVLAILKATKDLKALLSLTNVGKMML